MIKQEVKEIIEKTGKYIECSWDEFFNDIGYTCFMISCNGNEPIYFKENSKQ